MTPSCSDAEFIALWQQHGSPTKVAEALKVGVRAVAERRRSIESRHGIALVAKGPGSSPALEEGSRVIVRHHEGRIDYSITDGVGIVFSDGHFWPGIRSTAFRALAAMARKLKPDFVVCNGDAFDGASISRWPVMQWMERDKKPTVVQELNACKGALEEVEDAAPKAQKFWTLGNHDARYEARLASMAPEFGGIQNFHLKDHFPLWRPAWTVWVNDAAIITHSYHNGIHATHNNVIKGQVHYVTGHLHSLKVTPYTDARGETKYGVDTGTLADPMGPQFIDYMQGRHGNWRSGFAVLTYRDGKMLMPELVQKWDEDHVEFRGEILHADTLEARGAHNCAPRR